MMQQTFRPDESGHLQEQGKRIIIGREESHVSITPEEKGAMEEGHLRFSGMIGNGDGEEAGILVVHMDKIDVIVGSKGREPQSLPVK